jgi:predicted small lipoprotein YifL
MHRSRYALAVMLCAALAGCGLTGGRRKPTAAVSAPARVTAIGVNAYLWRAALDTLSFMPMAQVDSNGGVIVTEWRADPRTPNERVKVSVTILDADLRADAVRVATARQIQQNGQWVDAAVQASTNQKLEEIILQKARDLRRDAGRD